MPLFYVLFFLVLYVPSAVFAQEEPSCKNIRNASSCVACALANNIDLTHAREQLLVLRANKTALQPWFPSQPVLSVSAAKRRNNDPLQAWNWYVTLSQEIDISGQRSARLQSVDASMAAQVRRVAAIEQETQATALTLYASVLAAQAQMDLAKESKNLSDAIILLAQAQLGSSMISALEFDIAYADAVHLASTFSDAQQRLEDAENALKQYLSLPQNVVFAWESSLSNTSSTWTQESVESLVERALVMRADIAALEEEKKSSLHRTAALQRSRIPNITFSVTAQEDGFKERVYGAGVSIPLPTPNRISPYRTGALEQEKAAHTQITSSEQALRAQVAQQVRHAHKTLHTQHTKLGFYTQTHVKKMQQNIHTLKEAVHSRHYSLREALMMQHIIVDFLMSYMDTRTSFIHARIELARATSSSFDGILQ